MIYKLPRYFLSSFESICLFVQEKFKIKFQNGHHCCQLGFPIGTILAIHDLQVVMILPSKFHWFFGSGDEEQARFLKWPQ